MLKILISPLKDVNINIINFEKVSISLRKFWKILILIREFCKISISIEYCINKNLAYIYIEHPYSHINENGEMKVIEQPQVVDEKLHLFQAEVLQDFWNISNIQDCLDNFLVTLGEALQTRWSIFWSPPGLPGGAPVNHNLGYKTNILEKIF